MCLYRGCQRQDADKYLHGASSNRGEGKAIRVGETTARWRGREEEGISLKVVLGIIHVHLLSKRSALALEPWLALFYALTSRQPSTSGRISGIESQ